jgi:hypothetical protein
MQTVRPGRASVGRRDVASAAAPRPAPLARAVGGGARCRGAPALPAQICAPARPMTASWTPLRGEAHLVRALATKETATPKSGLPERPLSVCIAGGGIGGLVLAVALLKKGVQVRAGAAGAGGGRAGGPARDARAAAGYSARGAPLSPVAAAPPAAGAAEGDHGAPGAQAARRAAPRRPARPARGRLQDQTTHCGRVVARTHDRRPGTPPPPPGQGVRARHDRDPRRGQVPRPHPGAHRSRAAQRRAHRRPAAGLQRSPGGAPRAPRTDPRPRAVTSPTPQIQSNALAALEAVDAEMAEEILAVGCVTGDRVNGLCDGVTGDWYCKFDTFHPAVDRGLPVTRVVSRVTLQQISARTAIKLGGEGVIEPSSTVESYEEFTNDAGGREGA